MKLADIFPHQILNSSVKGFVIKGISDDSRDTGKGDIFFIRERKNFDIYSALKDVEPLAAAFIAQAGSAAAKVKSLVKNKPLIFVKDIEKEFLRAVDLFYNFKNKSLKIIGITGTNGKTTTAFLIYHILKELGQKPSLIGTVKYLIGSKEQKAGYTTPDFLKLRKILKEAAGCGSRFLVMEASSHAIDQQRIKGVDFSRCVFTNLSRDHLDYHRTMDSYFNVKKELFLKNKNAFSVINTDDKYGRSLYKELKNKLSYGIVSGAALKAGNIKLNRKGFCFSLSHKNKSYSIDSKLCGRYNILNILAALGTVSSLGFSLSDSIKHVLSFAPPEGRLEAVSEKVFVDYAHTPDALKNALGALKDSGYKKIICVFGCGGNRDKGKRSQMGRVASKEADFTFITSDNPRNECSFEICRQIEKGFSGENYSVVADRKKAIEEALKMRGKSGLHTCLLVAGKGHEGYQIIGDKKIPFKDSEVIKSVMRAQKAQRLKEPC